MAMSETMSPGPNDWAQFYQHNLMPAVQPQSNHFAGGRVSDATVVSTTVTGTVAPPSLGQRSLSPEGRVSKPVRRRTRASRRTPTTVLNTDTANFRAMVQQFTGGPALAQAQPGQYPIPNGSNLSFGFGLASNIPRHQPLVNPTPVRAAGGYNMQFQQPQSGPGNVGLSFPANNHNSNMGHSFPGNGHRGSSPPPPSGNGNMNETNNYMF